MLIRDRTKKFVIISLVIFSVIVVLSTTFFKTCNSNYCNFNFISILNMSIIGAGIIGLIYCFYMLKDFNVVIDEKIAQNYKKILLDDKDQEK